MAKIKKISINSLDKIVKDTYIPTETVVWNDIEVIVKKTLSFKEMMMFVSEAAKLCFNLDDGAYLPEVRDFAIKSCALDLYTNISMPENIEHKYSLIYCSDIVKTVLQYVNVPQFNEIVRAVNDKVDNMAQANIEMVNKQMNELYTSFDNLQKNFTDVFSGIGSEDMTKLVGAISTGKLDEDKLVKAYINQTKQEDGKK